MEDDDVVTGTTEGDPAAGRLVSPLLERVALAPLPLEVAAATESCGGLGQAVDGLAGVAEVAVVPAPPLGTLLLAMALDPTTEEEEQKEEEDAAEVAAVRPAAPAVDFIPDAGVEQVEARPDPSTTAAN